MQGGNNLLRLIRWKGVLKVREVEPLLESIQVFENVWKYEVEERPKFCKIILLRP